MQGLNGFIQSLAVKSPFPLAGIIKRTPELLYLAAIFNTGIVNLASNGFPFSLNL